MTSSRFTLQPSTWYACEIIDDGGVDPRALCSPIRVDHIEPLGNRTFTMRFYDLNYPEGVRDKEYCLKTLFRGESFILAVSRDHRPARMLRIHHISAEWLRTSFPGLDVPHGDVQRWLSSR